MGAMRALLHTQAPSRVSTSERASERVATRATTTTTTAGEPSRRRVVHVFFASAVASALEARRANALEASERESAFVAELKRKSDEKAAERKQERLDAYNKKNFGDYLDWVAGNDALKEESALSANDLAIRAYLKSIKG